MIYEMRIEYRELNILRVRFLRSLQESGGLIHLKEFSKMLNSVIRNCNKDFERLLIDQVKEDQNSISYHKLCELINHFQYQLHFVKYIYSFNICYRKPKETYVRPLTQLKKDTLDASELDTILDYFWCRLSEKYIKLSKAFCSMDITQVCYISSYIQIERQIEFAGIQVWS